MCKTICTVMLLLVFSFGFSGCISQKSYLDPSYPKISYDDIKKRQTPLRLKLVAEFQRNGEHKPNVDSVIQDKAERILRASGVIVPAPDSGEGSINIVLNNISDMGGAMSKGFGTGLTFGLVGNTVADAYEMTISITINGKTIERTALKHAIYTAIGNTSTPNDVEILSLSTAVDQVLEQLILRGLRDMQDAQELTYFYLPPTDSNFVSIVKLKGSTPLVLL